MIFRKKILRKNIESELKCEKPNIEKIIKFIDEYEIANLNTIKKLKRRRELDFRKINGAIKQTINAHGPITKNLIGSATKRIYGALLEYKNESKLVKILKCITNK